MHTKIIEKHLDRQLNPEEQHEFSLRMKNDQTFRQEVELYEQIVEAIRQTGRKQTIRSVHQSYMNDRRQSTHSTNFPWLKPLAAACLLFVMGAAFLFYQLPSGQQLYQSTYTPYKIHIMRSENQDLLNAYYAQQNYEKFLQTYEAIAQPDAHQRMMAGNVHLSLGNNSQAIEHFKTLQTQSNTELAEVAQWYLALTFLKTEQTDKAYYLLKEIQQQPLHLYHPYVDWSLMLKVSAARLY